MKLFPCLLSAALGTALLCIPTAQATTSTTEGMVAAAQPEQAEQPAAAQPAPVFISTIQGIRSVLSDMLEFRYTIDSDGDIRLDFNDAPTVWISFISGGKKQNAEGDGELSVIRVFSQVATADLTEYDKYVALANKFNHGYVQKAYVSADDEHCVFVMEHYEFVSDTYTANQFILGFVAFVRQVANLKDGKTSVSL